MLSFLCSVSYVGGSRIHLYNNICLMCPPHPPATQQPSNHDRLYVLSYPVALSFPCVVPGNSWQDGRPDLSGGPQGGPLGAMRLTYPPGYPSRDPLRGIPQGPPGVPPWFPPGDSLGSRIPQGLGTSWHPWANLGHSQALLGPPGSPRLFWVLLNPLGVS